MRRRKKARPIYARWLLLGLGWIIIAVGVAIGPLPGPGQVIIVPLGLALVLRNSIWAKRVYIRTKRRHEAVGKWTDWALGRAWSRGNMWGEDM